jgi:hypothetical protein
MIVTERETFMRTFSAIDPKPPSQRGALAPTDVAVRLTSPFIEREIPPPWRRAHRPATGREAYRTLH